MATAENAAPDVIKQMGCISIVCPQVCFGCGYPENDPELRHTGSLYARCKELGLGIAGWAWCDDAARAADEATYHASVAQELGLGLFVANMEEPYDAHGNSSDPRMWAPDTYAAIFRDHAPDVELGLTTTPRWASSGNEMRAVGATVMPQAFCGDIPDATISNCVSHAQAWGWDISRIRPLVQVYQPRPSPADYNADAANCQVGVVPYVVEQAFDPDGIDMVKTLAPSITRQPAALPPQQGPPAGTPPDLPFKRALYPPDAAQKGKTPSPPGPDVEAVKRATSRAGFWPWRAFDQDYSNNFAHGGDGPGMEGFQAAHVDLQGKPPSGWYGSASHEALRCFVIPSGPHAGEFAFDSKAISLYRSA